MPLTPQQQSLYNIGGPGTLPGWWFQDETWDQEMLQAFAVIQSAAMDQVVTWKQMTFILQATGIWLDQHARDRGTFRQNGETDIALRSRLREIEDAVNVPSVLAAASRALARQPISPPMGYPAIVELRRDRAFMGTFGTPAPIDSPNQDGRKMAYLSRGYRMGSTRSMSFIVILPYGTTAATAASAAEEIRKKRAAGFPSIVERRLNP